MIELISYQSLVSINFQYTQKIKCNFPPITTPLFPKIVNFHLFLQNDVFYFYNYLFFSFFLLFRRNNNKGKYNLCRARASCFEGGLDTGETIWESNEQTCRDLKIDISVFAPFSWWCCCCCWCFCYYHYSKFNVCVQFFFTCIYRIHAIGVCAVVVFNVYMCVYTKGALCSSSIFPATNRIHPFIASIVNRADFSVCVCLLLLAARSYTRTQHISQHKK